MLLPAPAAPVMIRRPEASPAYTPYRSPWVPLLSCSYVVREVPGSGPNPAAVSMVGAATGRAVLRHRTGSGTVRSRSRIAFSHWFSIAVASWSARISTGGNGFLMTCLPTQAASVTSGTTIPTNSCQ